MDLLELTIKNKISKEGKANSYQVDIEWMHGDANGESHTLTGFFKKDQDEWALEELLLALKELQNVYHVDYDSNETFNKWFEGNESEFSSRSNLEKEENKKYKGFVGLAVENDLTDSEFYASIDKYKVYYYDENLAKYNVNVKL